LRILRDQSAAEDVTIDVYMQAYRTASQYDPRRGTPSAWLSTLTHSRAIDCLRWDTLRQQHETSLELVETLPTSAPDPEGCSTASELQQIVQRALAALSPEQRQVQEELVLPAKKRTFIERSRETVHRKRRKVLWPVGATLLTAVLVVGGVFGWRWFETYRQLEVRNVELSGANGLPPSARTGSGW
jgi:RNA polymerase sigma factor (sigma-70 family)